MIAQNGALAGISPRLGFKPTRPQQAAGTGSILRHRWHAPSTRSRQRRPPPLRPTSHRPIARVKADCGQPDRWRGSLASEQSEFRARGQPEQAEACARKRRASSEIGIGIPWRLSKQPRACGNRKTGERTAEILAERRHSAEGQGRAVRSAARSRSTDRAAARPLSSSRKPTAPRSRCGRPASSAACIAEQRLRGDPVRSPRQLRCVACMDAVTSARPSLRHFKRAGLDLGALGFHGGHRRLPGATPLT